MSFDNEVLKYLILKNKKRMKKLLTIQYSKVDKYNKIEEKVDNDNWYIK